MNRCTGIWQRILYWNHVNLVSVLHAALKRLFSKQSTIGELALDHGKVGTVPLDLSKASIDHDLATKVSWRREKKLVYTSGSGTIYCKSCCRFYLLQVECYFVLKCQLLASNNSVNRTFSQNFVNMPLSTVLQHFHDNWNKHVDETQHREFSQTGWNVSMSSWSPWSPDISHLKYLLIFIWGLKVRLTDLVRAVFQSTSDAKPLSYMQHLKSYA